MQESTEDCFVDRRIKYPWRTMAVGESFFAHGFNARQITKRAYLFKPRRFKAKTVVRGGSKGARVWRVA
jgi:hypothetical protein